MKTLQFLSSIGHEGHNLDIFFWLNLDYCGSSKMEHVCLSIGGKITTCSEEKPKCIPSGQHMSTNDILLNGRTEIGRKRNLPKLRNEEKEGKTLP
ncbi:CLUMA_CG006854, isoform A [Clunio marinus]|uniref:CLUMA_CG006854, isoform A n=1 Tax=Clunio marinus TaxID=568069 RepID=A0A1J1I4K5_9DIPT|nr:CLUMA_CG006854, isoform A [Clunio marinus]